MLQEEVSKLLSDDSIGARYQPRLGFPLDFKVLRYPFLLPESHHHVPETLCYIQPTPAHPLAPLPHVPPQAK